MSKERQCPCCGSANLCMDCGYVMLIGDMRKANKLLNKSQAH